MAIVNGYCTLSGLKSFVGIGDGNDDTLLEESVEAASRQIDAFCGRIFYADTNATPRKYFTTNPYRLRVDDFYTLTGLVVRKLSVITFK